MEALTVILAIILFLICSMGFLISITWAMKRYQQHNQQEWKHKQHPDLALIALPVVYVQPYENGVMIQDSKSRLHYFTDRGYRWEPLENIEI
ncbi:hypothetical protein [Phaeodactylibacter xiamenensis]|uniref:hypothetical protein n=1 Tax=Phaeodactylibacter xiamenensis TaxID=1524460 RepID=UPI0024A803FD|nr:hypothetical protein [Phaeodactylibacter xiamenensis]